MDGVSDVLKAERERWLLARTRHWCLVVETEGLAAACFSAASICDGEGEVDIAVEVFGGCEGPGAVVVVLEDTCGAMDFTNAEAITIHVGVTGEEISCRDGVGNIFCAVSELNGSAGEERSVVDLLEDNGLVAAGMPTSSIRDVKAESDRTKEVGGRRQCPGAIAVIAELPAAGFEVDDGEGVAIDIGVAAEQINGANRVRHIFMAWIQLVIQGAGGVLQCQRQDVVGPDVECASFPVSACAPVGGAAHLPVVLTQIDHTAFAVTDQRCSGLLVGAIDRFELFNAAAGDGLGGVVIRS